MNWAEVQEAGTVLEACAWCSGLMGILWVWTRYFPSAAATVQRPIAAFSAMLTASASSGSHGPVPILMLLSLALFPLVSPRPGRNHASRSFVLAWNILFAIDQVAQYQWWRYRRELPEWVSSALWFGIAVVVPVVAVVLKVRALRQEEQVTPPAVLGLHPGRDGA